MRKRKNFRRAVNKKGTKLYTKMRLQEEKICDNLSIESIRTLDNKFERVKVQMYREEILKKHKPAINKEKGRDLYYTRLDGKKVRRKTREELEEVIVDYYLNRQFTIASVFPRFLETKKMEVSPNTWTKYMSIYDQYISGSELDTIPFNKITIDDGYEFLRHCLRIKPQLKKKYWSNIIGVVNQVFIYAKTRGLMKGNPFEYLKPRKDLFDLTKKTRDGDTVFTKAEQTHVCRIAEHEAKENKNPIALGIVILFNLGVRIGELCAVKWGDIETGVKGQYVHIQRELVNNIDDNGKRHGYIIVNHCKSDAGDRRLELNDKAINTFKWIRMLNNQLGIPTGLDDNIFLRMEKDEIKLCFPRTVDNLLRRYCSEAGMTVIKSPHDIRRTVITNLYYAGMPLKNIQRYAGHSSLKQTMDYIRLSDDEFNPLEFLNTLSEEVEDNIVEFERKIN